MKPIDKSLARLRRAVVVIALGATPLALFSGSAHAIALQWGELYGSFDTTVSYGMQIRTQDEETVTTSIYGRRKLFPDAGDIISNQIKAGHDLELKNSQWGDATWGLFMRGNYFYDFEMANQPLPKAAENRAESHGDITDGFVWGRFGPSAQLMLRLGKQVISWGESTFIQGSINDINTLDLSKLRQPGSELKDAFLGSQAIFGQWTISDAFNLEAFYLLEFQEIFLDPVGNFFGTNDRIRDGGGFPNSTRKFAGRRVDDCKSPDAPPFDPVPASTSLQSSCSFGPITRIGDDVPSGSGQWGLALRYFAPNFLSGFEFGFYYLNLHDHGGVLSTVVGGTPSSIATSTSAMSPRYFLEYVKDVERYGFSFNTGVAGWALSGELGYRRNEPTQNVQALQAAPFDGFLGPSTGAFGPVGSVFSGAERFKRYQAQMTAQRFFGPVNWLKTTQFALITEYAYGWSEDYPHRRFGAGVVNPFTPFNPVSNNWSGIQVRTSQQYDRLLFNYVNLQVSQALSWDLDGVSPEVSPLFIEDRKRFTLGLAFDWQAQYSLTLSQTVEWGGEDVAREPMPIGAGGKIFSPLGDFFSATFRYSF